MTQSIFFDVIARDKASNTFSRVGKASDSARGRLIGFSKSAATAAVGFTSVTVAAAAFIRTGADYVGSLNKIQALTDANDKTIGKAAKTLESQSSSYAKMGQTVGDAAGGVVELTKAGLSLNSSLKAVNATMVLAKAGELNVADASSLVANTLNTFHLKAERAGDIANYLANAANISSADVTDLAESFKYVSPIAAATGVSLEQTNAILAELSNSGISAANAGTGFRKFLLSLQAPSGQAATDLKDLGVKIFDAQGKMKPLGTVIDLLDTKLSKLTDQKRQKILKDVFGLQGVSSAQVILNGGARGLDEYTRGVRKAGAAQKLANSASKGFAGTLASLRAEIISDAQAAYRNLSPSFDEAAKKVLAFIQQMKSGEGAGGDFANTLKALADVGKTALKILDSLPGPVKKFGAEGLIAYVVLGKLTSGMSAMGNSLAMPIARTKQMYAEMTYAETRMGRLNVASTALKGALTNVAGAAGMLAVVDGTQRANKSVGVLETTLGGLAIGLQTGGPIGAGIGVGIGLFYSLKSAIAGTNDVKMPTPKQLGITDIINGLNEANGKATEFTKNSIFDFLTGKKKGVAPFGIASGAALQGTAQLYGIPDRQLVNAMAGNVKAYEAIRDRFIAIQKKHPDGFKGVAGPIVQQDRELLLSSIRTSMKAFREQRAEQLKNIAVNKDYGKSLDALPRDKRIKVEATGIIPTVRGIADVAARIKATPDEVSTLITASGVPTTIADVQRAIDKANAYGRLTPSAKLDANTQPAKTKVNSLVDYIRNALSGKFSANVNVHSGSKGGIGGLLSQTTGNGKSNRTANSAGRTFSSSYADGINFDSIKVSKALTRLERMSERTTSKLADLRSTRQDFLSTFQSDNLFGTDLSGGGGINSLLTFEQKQAQQASQLLADIKTAASKGLSKSLISQLQAQGTSGAEQLHALAMGSTGQIQQLNALNAQTQASLQAAGLFAGNTVRGGNINADIASTSRDERLIEKLIKRLDRMDGDVVIQIEGETIVRAIKKRNRKKGVASAGL